jgi:hypothetical protein
MSIMWSSRAVLSMCRRKLDSHADPLMGSFNQTWDVGEDEGI